METSISRRAFARAGAAALAAAAALPAAAQSAPAAAAAHSETEATVSRILARYGSRLTAEQRQRLPRIVEGHVAMLETVRKVEFDNSAAPAAVLQLVEGRRA
ncbi:MAG TPA: hypothetical protein VFP94_04890 [Terriglobales bacterium]|nr:hypothetical protein [Terriglobales bacterium]